MLYLYATIFNNITNIEKSIESLNKINTEKKFLIVDNYSNDGSYELLCKLKLKYNIVLKRAKCTRGNGKQLAMEIAYNESNENDMFMTFDLDTIYLDNFVKSIEKAVKNMEKNHIYLNQLSYKISNFKVPWTDLNYGEDWERLAHFLSLGYSITINNPKIIMWSNQYVDGPREKRYAEGFSYIKREFKNRIDLFVGWNVNSFKNFKTYIEYSKTGNKLTPILFIIFLYVRLFKQTYNYTPMLNIFYVKKYCKFVEYEDFLDA